MGQKKKKTLLRDDYAAKRHWKTLVIKPDSCHMHQSRSNCTRIATLFLFFVSFKSTLFSSVCIYLWVISTKCVGFTKNWPNLPSMFVRKRTEFAVQECKNEKIKSLKRWQGKKKHQKGYQSESCELQYKLQCNHLATQHLGKTNQMWSWHLSYRFWSHVNRNVSIWTCLRVSQPGSVWDLHGDESPCCF